MAQIIETKSDENGREYLVYDDGTTKWKDNGYFRTNNPNYAITPQRGHELAAIARENALLDKARAFARKQGVDVENATPEEIMEGFGKAREDIHGKAYDLFMEAKSARGVEGLYPKLISDVDAPPVYVIPSQTFSDAERLSALSELVKVLKEAIEPERIEGKAS